MERFNPNSALRLGIASTLMIAIALTAASADERSRDEILAGYYLWDYYLLEGSSVLREYTRAEFRMPSSGWPESMTNDGPVVFVRSEIPDTEIGFADLSLGPVSLGASVATRSLFATFDARETVSGPVAWEYSDGSWLNSFLGPALGWSGTINVADVAELSYRHRDRSFYSSTVLPEDIDYSWEDGLPPRVTTESGQAFSAAFYPSNAFPSIPVLSAIPILKHEVITEELEPRGFVSTGLVESDALVSKLFLQVGESEVADIRFAKAGGYVFLDIFFAELEYQTLRDGWFHNDWMFRRGRIGVDLVSALWRPRMSLRQNVDSYRSLNTFGGPFLAGIYLTHEWRQTPPALIPGVPAATRTQGFGAAYNIMSRLPNFDMLVEGNAFVPDVGLLPMFDQTPRGRLPLFTLSLELRYRFPQIGERS